MGKKAVIGVLPLYDEKLESLWMLPAYFDLIRQAGGIPVMLPLDVDKEDFYEIDSMFDGYLFTGGQDIATSLYGEVNNGKSGEPIAARDSLEKIVFDKAYADNKPMLGICRGLQIINAFLGGTLYQDIPTENPSDVSHRMTSPYDREIHKVNVSEDSSLYNILNKERIGVNSYHHQAIKLLAPSLKAMAVADDGIVEAFECPDKTFLWAVQWHPEFNYKVNEDSVKIAETFVKACEG